MADTVPDETRGPGGAWTVAAWQALLPTERMTAWQADWWRRNRARELEKRRDPTRRDRANELRRLARASHRAEHAAERLAADCARIGPARHKRPRLIGLPAVSREPIWVWPVGALAVRIGRRPATVRTWLTVGIIPGATIEFAGKAYFSERAMVAIRRARERELATVTGGSRDLLRRLIREELQAAGESWVPRGRTETGRVLPGRAS